MTSNHELAGVVYVDGGCVAFCECGHAFYAPDAVVDGDRLDVAIDAVAAARRAAVGRWEDHVGGGDQEQPWDA